MNTVLSHEIDLGLDKFTPGSLDDLNRMMMLNRYDTKLPLHDAMLPEFLEALKDEYKVLEIDSHRIFNYSSCYYDTDAYDLYLLHHNGKSNRLKVRNRKYIESGMCFIEIKKKNNHSMTDKSRMTVEWHDCQKLLSASRFLRENAELDANELSRKLIVEYKRITLMNEEKKEKITIDLDINYKTDNCEYMLDGLTLVELKHKSFANTNSAYETLKRMHVRPAGGFSKYCMGIVFTGQAAKSNRFKSQILAINKIMGA